MVSVPGELEAILQQHRSALPDGAIKLTSFFSMSMDRLASLLREKQDIKSAFQKEWGSIKHDYKDHIDFLSALVYSCSGIDNKIHHGIKINESASVVDINDIFLLYAVYRAYNNRSAWPFQKSIAISRKELSDAYWEVYSELKHIFPFDQLGMGNLYTTGQQVSLERLIGRLSEITGKEDFSRLGLLKYNDKESSLELNIVKLKEARIIYRQKGAKEFDWQNKLSFNLGFASFFEIMLFLKNLTYVAEINARGLPNVQVEFIQGMMVNMSVGESGIDLAANSNFFDKFLYNRAGEVIIHPFRQDREYALAQRRDPVHISIAALKGAAHIRQDDIIIPEGAPLLDGAYSYNGDGRVFQLDNLDFLLKDKPGRYALSINEIGKEPIVVYIQGNKIDGLLNTDDVMHLRTGQQQSQDKLYSAISEMLLSGNQVRYTITKCPDTSRFMSTMDEPVDISKFFMELARVKDHTTRRIRLPE